MGDIPKFGELTGNETLQELIDRVAQLQKMINWWGAGNVSSVNAREFGGWRVAQTELRSLDGDVGMSTANDSDDPVRMWAGSTDKNDAPWRVTKSGKEHSTGATIESTSGYPKYLLDPDTGTIKVMFSEDTYMEIVPNFDETSPVINFVSSGSTHGQIIVNSSGQFQVLGSGGLKLVGGDIILSPDQVTGKKVRIPDFSILVNSGGTDLQSALNLKVNFGDSTSSAGGGSFNGGIPIGTQLATSDGGSVTWAGINIPSHQHTVGTP